MTANDSIVADSHAPTTDLDQRTAESKRGIFLWRRTQSGTGLELPILGAWRYVLVVVAAGLLAASFIGLSGRYSMGVFSVGCAYLVGALGFNLIVGYNGQLNFGYAGFLAIGGYGYAIMQQNGYGPLLSIIVAVAASTIGGLLLGLAVLRARHFYLALITLAFAQAVVLALSRWSSQTHGDDGISARLNGRDTVYVSIVVAIIALLAIDRTVRSRFGRAIVMVRSEENVAQAMGVPSGPIGLIVSAIGGAFGGLSGVLLSSTLGFITPANFSVELTVLLLHDDRGGRFGLDLGNGLGTTIIMVLNQYLAESLGSRDIIYGLVLFAALTLFPGGVVNLPERIRSVRAKLRRRRGTHHEQRSVAGRRSRREFRCSGGDREPQRRRAGRVHQGHHRTQRRRQDDPAQRDHRLGQTEGRKHQRLRRPEGRADEASAVRASEAGHPANVPALQPLQRAVGTRPVALRRLPRLETPHRWERSSAPQASSVGSASSSPVPIA